MLTPISLDVSLPLVFLEAPMQTNTEFSGRYFAGIFVYLDQYKIARSGQGLLIAVVVVGAKHCGQKIRVLRNNLYAAMLRPKRKSQSQFVPAEVGGDAIG